MRDKNSPVQHGVNLGRKLFNRGITLRDNFQVNFGVVVLAKRPKIKILMGEVTTSSDSSVAEFLRT